MTWGRRNIPGLALEGATEARVGRGQCPHCRAWGSQHCMFKVLKVFSRRLKIIYN